MKTEIKGTRRRRATGSGARVGGDHPSLHIISIIGVVLTAVAAWTISFTALLAVAGWQAYPEQIHFMTAIEIDVPVIVFTVTTIVFKAREQAFAEWIARILAVGMTILSAGANFLHTVSIRGLGSYQDWIGASFNALAPVLVLACTEILGLLITRPKTKNTALARTRAALTVARAELKAVKRDLRVAPKLVGGVAPGTPTPPTTLSTTATTARAFAGGELALSTFGGEEL